MSASLQKYYHIVQSRGEIHVLPLKVGKDEVHAVGTSGCRTCMCVYLRFNDGTVFIAHMVAQSTRALEALETAFEDEKAAITCIAYDDYQSQWTSILTRGYLLKRKVLLNYRPRYHQACLQHSQRKHS